MTKHGICKKIVTAVVALVMVAGSALGIMCAFAATESALLSFSTSGGVMLDGISDAQVTVRLTAAMAEKLYTAQGWFSTTETDDAEQYFTVNSFGVNNIINSGDDKEHESSSGYFWYKYSETGDGVEFDADDYLYEMVYDVKANTPAGTYHLPINIEYVQQDDLGVFEEDVEVDAVVTVTRSQVSNKPSQVVTFVDENGEPIGDEGITKYYGADDFIVTKSVTTGDGEIYDYHPDDDGYGTIAHTDPNNDYVGVGEPGDVKICAWVSETDNYAATTACYWVHVVKRPLTIESAIVATKTYDGLSDGTVTSVSFVDWNLENSDYEASAEFGDADAGTDKGVRVEVELKGEAVNHYDLTTDYINTTGTILPFMLTAENVTFVNGDTYTYSLGGVMPAITVEAGVHGGTSTLVETEDYEMYYSNNDVAGTGHVVITGIQNFTTGEGPLVIDFTIERQTIAGGDLILPSTVVAGHNLTGDEVSVNVDGHDLVQCAQDGDSHCDYVVAITGDNGGEAGGTVHVEVSGRGNYNGTLTGDVDIVAKAVQSVSFGNVTNTTVNKTYGDAKFIYEATADGGGTVSYRSTNESVLTVDGNGEVTIVGTGDADIIATASETSTHAEATAKYSVHVSKKVLTVTDATVSNKVYDGTPIATVSSVTLSEGSLVYNTDFTATGLFSGVDVALRDVTVMVALTDEMFNNYCFMFEESCLKNTSYSAVATITAFAPGAERESVTLNETSFTYSGNENKPAALVKVDLDGDGVLETTLVEGTDYDMRYYNNIDVGTGTAYMTAKGNYNFSVLGLSFTINAAPVESVEVTAPSQDYTGSALEPVPTVTGIVNGSRVEFTTDDYSIVAHGNFIQAGDYSFSVTSIAQGNYYIPATAGTFTINKIASGNPPEMTANLKIEAGKTLTELGDRSAGFTWLDGVAQVTEGEGTYPATYTQNDDSTNYTPIDVLVPVYGLKRIEVLTGIMGGGSVEGPGASALEGEDMVFRVTPDDGYELISFFINDTDLTRQVVDNQITVKAGTEDITVVVIFRRVYSVINTEGVPHTKGVDGAAVFEFDADYELFEDGGIVLVDGEELDVENYESWSASTVISLRAGYLDSLSTDEHTLTVRFTDGSSAQATFAVVEAEASEDDLPVPNTGVFTGIGGGEVALGASVVIAVTVAAIVYMVARRFKKA